MLRTSKTHRTTNLRTIAVAAFVGGLAGTVLGLMLAPKSGKELRLGIFNKTDNAIKHVEDITTHSAEALKQQGTELVDKGKKLAEDLQTFIQEALQKKPGNIPMHTAMDTQTETLLQKNSGINSEAPLANEAETVSEDSLPVNTENVPETPQENNPEIDSEIPQTTVQADIPPQG
jgi:gas vesicle protein